MGSLNSSRRGLTVLTPLMAAAVLVAAPGCSTKTVDTNSGAGTTSVEVTTSGAEPTGALGAAPGAGGGQEPQSDAGFTPPTYCGSKDDANESLWTDVKDKTPTDKGPNIKVVKISEQLGYALHNGDKVGEKHKYNLLVIPTERVTGIECKDILEPTKVLNLWKYAWDDARDRFGKSEDIMLGVNSKDGRSHNQLHIHLTGLKSDIRNELDKLTNVPTDLNKWNESMYVLGGHAYRIVRVKSLDTNPFNLLQDNVVKKFQDRFQQSMAVVADTKNGGFYLITTQGTPEKGQPEHDPELKVEQGGKKYYGSKAIDDLMNLD
jgi:CDP-diacylglycerol pyrophosphatase